MAAEAAGWDGDMADGAAGWDCGIADDAAGWDCGTADEAAGGGTVPVEAGVWAPIPAGIRDLLGHIPVWDDVL